jgi:hypothetical protein
LISSLALGCSSSSSSFSSETHSSPTESEELLDDPSSLTLSARLGSSLVGVMTILGLSFLV